MTGVIDVAEAVLGWQAAGRSAAVARTISVQGMSSLWPEEALAASADERAGNLLGGAGDDQLLPLLREVASAGRARQAELTIGDVEASAAGLACGGRASVLVQPTSDVPDEAWQTLAAREPVCLVTLLDGEPATTVAGQQELTRHDSLLDPSVRNLFGQGTSQSAELELGDGRRVLVTTSWPPCRMVVLGAGHLAAGLGDLCRLLGWQAVVVPDTDSARALDAVGALARGDAVVVLSHDIEVSAGVLARALTTGVGYVGALGSRVTQAKRRDWLIDHGIEAGAVDRVRGPAGLDVGARTPAQIAVAVVAEVLAVRSGATSLPLRDRPGPVHAGPRQP